jgi:hypothetical protein
LVLKACLAVAAVLTGALLVVVLFSPQITSFYFAQDALRNEPAVELVPVRLTDPSIAEASGTTFRLYGHSFEVPWSEVAKTDEREALTRLEFVSGQVLVFFDPSQASGPKDLFLDNTKLGDEDVAAMFGASAASNHALAHTIANFRPSQVSLFTSRQEAVRNNMLTLMKRLSMVGAHAGLYSIERGAFRGFQRGDPARSRRVFLELFDDKDRLFSIWVYSSEPAPPLTQPEINRIVQTLE